MQLEGKVAVVTGGGQGVGRGIALALAAEGARVAIPGRTVSKCETVRDEIVARGGAALPLACNVTSLEDVTATVERVVDQWGTVDILVNNAQQVPNGPLLDVDDAHYQAGWESGPLATLRFMRLCHPYLSGDGVIINMASHAGVKPNPSNTGTYAGIKEEIRSLTRAAAWEWADDGIRTFSILPLANSPALEDFKVERPARYAEVLAQIPQGRFGDPERDIGPVIVFLCTPAAGYLTGISIPVDGGAAHIG